MNNRVRFISTAIAFLIFFSGWKQTEAQVKTAMLGVNGLTCSACSRTVEMSLRKLSFIKDVDMNLEHTEGKLTFSPGSDIDFSKIAKAVTDAGFSVRYLSAFYEFNKITINTGFCLQNNKYNLQFINSKNQTLNGEKEIKFLGQEFLPKSEFNKIRPSLINSCSNKNQKVYYVTLK